MRSGPVVIGYDGSPAAEHALREAGGLLAGRRALVVVVWKAGLAFELVELPASTVGLPPAPIDLRTAVEIERTVFERVQRMAEHGAQLAGDAGFDAEPQVVAEDPDVTVAETLIRVARERDAQAIVGGAHGHGRLDDLLLGSTLRDVIRNAPCPVVVARRPDDTKRH